MSKRKKTVVTPQDASQYRKFLNQYIAPKLAPKNKKEISKWTDVDLATPDGQIVDEIAKKFNNNQILGIGSVSYVRGSGQPNYYEGATASGKTKMTLAPPPNGRVSDGPRPMSVAHELVHANDHQIDFLNPLVWENLKNLATTGGQQRTPMTSFDELGTSIGKIQQKIAPGGEFKPDPVYPESGYPINKDYIEREIRAARNDPSYNIPLTADRREVPDWLRLFYDINSVVTTPPTSQQIVQNQGFYLNRGSEFPAFMSERLTVPWGTNTGTDSLSIPEARFIHSTLGNMDNAYPAQNYPTMNNHINQRRNSIETAYPGQFHSSSSSSSSSSGAREPIEEKEYKQEHSTIPSLVSAITEPLASSSTSSLASIIKPTSPKSSGNPIQYKILKSTPDKIRLKRLQDKSSKK